MATWMVHFRIADYICDIYNNFKGELDRKYQYFSEMEADNFITKCGKEIEEILIQEGVNNQIVTREPSPCNNEKVAK